MAKYRVEMTEFKCLDETGIDFFGSDEVVLTCSSFKGKQQRHSDTTREFGDVDSGDTRFLGEGVGPCPKKDRRDPHCRKFRTSFFSDDELEKAGLLWRRYRFPEATPAGGLSAPFSVVVIGVEVDKGGAERVKKDVEDIADIIEETALVAGSAIDIPDSARARISEALGNDAIGLKTVNFAKSDLNSTLPKVGGFFHTNVRITGGEAGDIPFTGGGDYRVKLLVSRLS